MLFQEVKMNLLIKICSYQVNFYSKNKLIVFANSNIPIRKLYSCNNSTRQIGITIVNDRIHTGGD